MFEIFITEFLAGLLVALLATLFIPAYLEKRKIRKSQMYLCFPNKDKGYQLYLGKDQNYKGILNLLIKNSSPFSLKEVFVNIWIPQEFEVELTDNTTDGKVTLTKNHPGTRISCILDRQIHPHRYFNFPCKIVLKIKKEKWNNENSFIYYYFSTEFSVFPLSAKLFNEETRQIKISDIRKNCLSLQLKKPS